MNGFRYELKILYTFTLKNVAFSSTLGVCLWCSLAYLMTTWFICLILKDNNWALMSKKRLGFTRILSWFVESDCSNGEWLHFETNVDNRRKKGLDLKDECQGCSINRYFDIVQAWASFVFLWIWGWGWQQ